MLRQVEADDFFLFSDSHADDPVDDLIEDQTPDEAIDEGNPDGKGLDQELPGVAEEETVGRVGVDELGGKEASSQGAPDTAHAVDAKGIEGVIVTQPRFDECNEDKTENAHEYADHYRRHGADEAGRRRNGDEARNHTRGSSENGRFPVVDPFDDGPCEA